MFVTKGIGLPKVKKNPLDEVISIIAKIPLAVSMNKDSFEKIIKEIEADSLPQSKNDELKELAKKWYGYSLNHKEHLCYICGYSTEFNCLIAGTYDECDNADTLGHTDYVNKNDYRGYFYIPLDDKFQTK